MAIIDEEFIFSREALTDQTVLLRNLEEMYRDIAIAVNRKPDMAVLDDRDPVAADWRYSIGTFWLNKDSSGGPANPTLWILESKTNPTTAAWTQIF